MNTKSNIMAMVAGLTLALTTAQAWAGEEESFKAIGKITESADKHTTQHKHELEFVRLADGEKFTIVDSPALLAAHCQKEINPVVEVEGYRTPKVLFGGGDLVVTSFKIHDDIEAPRIAHLNPKSVTRRAWVSDPKH